MCRKTCKDNINSLQNKALLIVYVYYYKWTCLINTQKGGNGHPKNKILTHFRSVAKLPLASTRLGLYPSSQKTHIAIHVWERKKVLSCSEAANTGELSLSRNPGLCLGQSWLVKVCHGIFWEKGQDGPVVALVMKSQTKMCFWTRISPPVAHGLSLGLSMLWLHEHLKGSSELLLGNSGAKPHPQLLNGFYYKFTNLVLWVAANSLLPTSLVCISQCIFLRLWTKFMLLFLKNIHASVHSPTFHLHAKLPSVKSHGYF